MAYKEVVGLSPTAPILAACVPYYQTCQSSPTPMAKLKPMVIMTAMVMPTAPLNLDRDR